MMATSTGLRLVMREPRFLLRYQLFGAIQAILPRPARVVEDRLDPLRDQKRSMSLTAFRDGWITIALNCEVKMKTRLNPGSVLGILSSVAMLVLICAPVYGQWVKVPTGGIPKRPDGKPNLSAPVPRSPEDRKSTRLNSSHQIISYAVFCLKKKNKPTRPTGRARRGGRSPRPLAARTSHGRRLASGAVPAPRGSVGSGPSRWSLSGSAVARI